MMFDLFHFDISLIVGEGCKPYILSCDGLFIVGYHYVEV